MLSGKAMDGVSVALDPDTACVAGVATCRIASVLARWLSWGGPFIPPTLALAVALATAALATAVLSVRLSLSYIGRSTAQLWADWHA